MTTEELKQLIEDAGYETRDYSGRGMYGKRCLAFIIEAGNELGAVAEMVYHSDDEEMVNIFKTARTDAMGRDDIVIYFPSMKI